MATSLDKLENKVQIHHRHLKRFHIMRRLQNLVQYVRRYSTKYSELRRENTTQFRLGSSPPKLLYQSSQNFTRYSGVSGAFQSCTCTSLSHTVSEWQSDKCRGGGNFAPFLPLNWLLSQCPLRYRKKSRTLCSSAIQYLPYGTKIVKIGPADAEILRLRPTKSSTTQNWLPWQRPLRYWKKNSDL